MFPRKIKSPDELFHLAIKHSRYIVVSFLFGLKSEKKPKITEEMLALAQKISEDLQNNIPKVEGKTLLESKKIITSLVK